MPHALRPHERGDEEGAEEVRPDQHRFPAEAVDDDARDRPEEQHRHHLGRNHPRDGQALPGEAEDQHDERDVVQGVPEVGEELPEP